MSKIGFFTKILFYTNIISLLKNIHKEKFSYIIFNYFIGNLEEKHKVAFQIYDINGDGFISNGDLFNSLRMLVGENLTDIQIQQLADRTIIAADKDLDGKISYEEFVEFVKDISIKDMFSVELFNN